MKALHKDLLLKNGPTLSYRLQFVSLLLVALTLPYSIGLTNAAVGLLALSWLVSGNYASKVKATFTNKLVLFFCSVFLIQVVGLLYTSNLEDGLGKLERKAALFVFPFLLAGSERLEQRHVQAVVAAFIFSCVGMAAYASYELLFTHGVYGSQPGLTELIDEILDMHHAYSGLYLVFAVAASCFLVLSRESCLGRKGKVLFAVLAVFLYAFLIVLAARTAVLTSFLLFVGAVVYYLLHRRKKSFVMGAMLASIALAFLVLSLPNTRSKIADFQRLQGVHSPLTPRLIKWGCCFTVLEEQAAWVLGVGTGDVQDHLQQCYSEEKFWGERYDLNAHNEYLEEFVRHGVVGLLLFLASLLVPFAMSLRRGKMLYLIFLTVFMVGIVTESMLSRQKGVVFYALFNSVLAFNFFKSKQPVRN